LDLSIAHFDVPGGKLLRAIGSQHGIERALSAVRTRVFNHLSRKI
jgi:hypothetical protein